MRAWQRGGTFQTLSSRMTECIHTARTVRVRHCIGIMTRRGPAWLARPVISGRL